MFEEINRGLVEGPQVARKPQFEEQLRIRKADLEAQLRNIDRAIEILKENPKFLELMNAVSSIHFY